jgi:hypothetical protein
MSPRNTLVEASARLLGSYEDRRPLMETKNGLMTPENSPYRDDVGPSSYDERPKSINLVRENTGNYGSFGDSKNDGLLQDVTKFMRARATAQAMYQRRKDMTEAIELLEGSEIERQLDEAYGYETNRNSLRPNGGYGSSVSPVDMHGYDADIDDDNYGNHEPGYGSAGRNDFLDPQEAENLARIASWRREAARNNVRPVGGGNFATMADRLVPAPAELGQGARVGQENPGPQPAHHDQAYRAGSAFDAGRALVGWLTKNLPSGGGRKDDGYFDGHSGVDAPELQTSTRHDLEFYQHQHALPTRDSDEGENERAFGVQTRAADERSRAYNRIVRGALDGRSYGDVSYDLHTPDDRARSQGYERPAF